ncbi:MAG: tetratricopeptide repeat protein [Acidobacteriota bacterium]|nr:tetratricopeptide repeat protein [Acidobacteriota bacterium]
MIGTARTALLYTLLAAVAAPCAFAQQPAAGTRTVTALIEQGKLEEARRQLEDRIKRNPQDGEAYRLLGVLAAKSGDQSSAVLLFRKAVQLAPNAAGAHSSLGEAYAATGQTSLAEAEFRTALRTNPADRSANYNLGVLLLARGDAAAAIPLFERVHPASRESQLNLIRAQLVAGHTAAALALATQVSAASRGDVALHVSLGVLLGDSGQFKAAELELARAAELQPESYEILLDLGRAALHNHDTARAELSVQHALRLHPDAPDALLLQSEIYLAESRYLDALESATHADKLAPNQPQTLEQMARISMAQQYFEDAIPLLERAAKLAPQRPELRSLLGEAYFRAENMDKAVETFRALNAEQESARNFAYLGMAHAYLGRFQEARSELNSCRKLQPRNASCLFYLGYLAKLQGNSTEAEQTFAQVLQESPEYPEAMLELANIRMEQHRFADAATLLRHFVKVSPNPARGYYRLSIAERNLHQSDAAQADLATFQRLSKDASNEAHPYDNLMAYVEGRSQMGLQARAQQDLSAIDQQLKLHPGQPGLLYSRLNALLQAAQRDEAHTTLQQLVQAQAGDAHGLTSTGVLLARYALYDEAIAVFQAAEQVQPGDDTAFDLADALYRKGRYNEARTALQQISTEGQGDAATQALLGDVYAHLGETARARQIYQAAIARNPDRDQNYLSLAMLQLRQGDLAEAKATLDNAESRIPGSGKILWGLGLVAAAQGDSKTAGTQLERAVEVLPEWPGSYATLGVFYYESGEVAKAREVFERFQDTGARSGLDMNRIAQVLQQTPATAAGTSMTPQQRMQLLQFALLLADKTL